MKILMVAPGYYPISGGTETVVRNLSVELDRIGVQVDVMTFNMDRKWNPRWRGKTEKIDGITVFKIPALNWMPIEHSPRITLGVNLIPGRFTNLLKQYDVIHFHEADLSFPLFSFLVRKPKVFHLHGFEVDFYKRYHLSRLIMKHVADLYISITRQMERDLAELGIPRSRIIYLPNAVDVKLFRPQGEKEDNLLLYLGRIVPNKGLHILLKSLHYLEKSVRLVIGGSADWSLKYYQRILKLIERENQKGKHEITYLGVLSQAEVIKWCQKASIFVCPSFMEAFGIVNIEALSCETPVIASNVGGIPEVINDHRNGILVPPGDAVKLGDAIQFLLKNENTRRKYGKIGRNDVLQHYSLTNVTEKLHKIYQGILN